MKKRSNFTPMERFHEILIGHGLDATNVGINHIRIFLDGKKTFRLLSSENETVRLPQLAPTNLSVFSRRCGQMGNGT